MRLRCSLPQAIQNILRDADDQGVVATEAMRPVGCADGHHHAAARVSASHRCSRSSLFPALVPFAVVGMPPGRTGRQDDEVLWSAIAACWHGQAVLHGQLAAVALVADDGVLAAEPVATLEVRPLEQPVVGAMDLERGLAIHELAVAAMIAAPKEA